MSNIENQFFALKTDLSIIKNDIRGLPKWFIGTGVVTFLAIIVATVGLLYCYEQLQISWIQSYVDNIQKSTDERISASQKTTDERINSLQKSTEAQIQVIRTEFQAISVKLESKMDILILKMEESQQAVNRNYDLAIKTLERSMEK
jgi:c-di-AMP phosphodiesterase-like protein